MTPLRRTMALDPPWAENGAGKVKRGADRHYPTMKVSDIFRTIMRSGFWTPDTRCCSVWMWATSNFLPDALWLLEQLGATYVTQAVWVKAHETYRCVECGSDNTEPLPDGTPLYCLRCQRAREGRLVIEPQAPGLGQRLRLCHELLLFGRIGRVPIPEPKDRLPSVIYAPRGRHSEKPAEAFELIERHDGPGSRLEWFARAARSGWDSWGNEAPGEAA